MVVIDGVRRSYMLVSQISASPAADSSSRCASRNRTAEGEPDSSSPSKRNVRRAGRAPVTATQARHASTKVRSCPLSSEAPRPRITAPGGRLLQHRVEGRPVPERQRVRRLDVVVAVEQQVPPLARAMPDDHRVPRRGALPGGDADLAKPRHQPVGGAVAVRAMGGVGRDRGDADELHQPLERARQVVVDAGENGVEAHADPPSDRRDHVSRHGWRPAGGPAAWQSARGRG